VWIERIDLRGFGRLAGEFVFGRGLTVVVGGNESGKSTLHEAIVRGLYGFSKSERRRSSTGSVRDMRAPWHGEAYGLNALVHARNGLRCRLEWDFRRHTVRLSDAAPGEDLSMEVRAKGDETTVGEWLVGLDREQFLSVCVVAQSDLEAVARSDALVSALQQAVETRGGCVGAEAADAVLGDFLREDLGFHQTQLRPLPGGLFARLSAEAADLRAAIAICRDAREESARLTVEVAEREREAERLTEAARARSEATANQLLAELGEALAVLAGLRRTETLTEAILLPQAELAFESALAGYETGRVDFATVLDAQRQIRRTRLELIRNRAEQQMRLADIERLVGEDL
jgi:DNA repair exonuclease SbcCD ATPase subunit